MSPDANRPEVVYCSGTNRFGRPCTRTVADAGDRCGHCRGTAELPDYRTALAKPPEPLDWTVAGTLADHLAPLAEGNPRLAKLVEVCIKLAANSRSTNSKAAYSQHWRTFTVFCDAVGLSSDLPVPAENVALFLAYLDEFGRVDRSTGERTGTGAPLRHGYLRQAISAIGYRHELHGVPSPSNDPLVQGVLRGYGRTYGTNTRGKDPIRLDGLTRIATALSQPPAMARRDRALLLLATDPALGLNAGQLARLEGEHLLLGDRASAPAALLVHPGGRSLHLDIVDLEPNPDVPAACALRALIDLSPPAHGPVFRSSTGRPLSRQAVIKIVRSALAAADLTPDDSAGIPRLADAGKRARLAIRCSQPDPADIRDLALILNLYWGAFRGSELLAMDWTDATTVDQGTEWNVRYAKNDQLGRGEIVGAARNPNPLLCPTTALDHWKATYRDVLGHDPTGDNPIFIRLDRRPDTSPENLTRDSAAQIIKRAATAAGLTGDFATHSLRAGFVSDALDAGSTREQVQRHGRWISIRSIDPYYRKTQTWGPNNPSQRLAGS